jgi:hypothetical protein
MPPLDDTDPDITPPYAAAPERAAADVPSQTPAPAPAVEAPEVGTGSDTAPQREATPKHLVTIAGLRVKRRTLALVAALWITVFAGGWLIGAVASGPSDDTVQTAPSQGTTSDATGPPDGSAAPDLGQGTSATSSTSSPGPAIEDGAGSGDAGQRRSSTTTTASPSDAEGSDDASDSDDPATSTTTSTEPTTTTTTTTTTAPEPRPQPPSAAES